MPDPYRRVEYGIFSDERRIGFNADFHAAVTGIMDAEGTGEEAIRAEVRRAIDENSFGGAFMPSYIPTNAEKLEIVKDEIIRYGGSIC